jgi:LDH2 family malate/lactate/ureidoglycolate dehydrogenase
MTEPPGNGTVLPAAGVRHQVAAIFQAAGASVPDAAVVAGDLVLSDQMGVRSHGVARTGEYVQAIEAGRLDPAGARIVVGETAATLLIDGGRGFGQCAGRFALDHAERKARESGSVTAVVRNSHHMGRVGALAEIGARRGLLVLALVAVGMPGQVAPFGGAEGRLGTNPIAYGIPAEGGAIVADFATAAMPEGAVNLARRLGQELPEGVLTGADGQPTTDPGALYTEPPGALLPFGGAWAHRGYALSLMVELFAGTLAGYGPTDPGRPSNSLFLVVTDPGAFVPDDGYAALASATAGFVRSARPRPGAAVQVPGEPEARALAAAGETVTLPDATVAMLASVAARLGAATPLGG